MSARTPLDALSLAPNIAPAEYGAYLRHDRDRTENGDAIDRCICAVDPAAHLFCTHPRHFMPWWASKGEQS